MKILHFVLICMVPLLSIGQELKRAPIITCPAHEHPTEGTVHLRKELARLRDPSFLRNEDSFKSQITVNYTGFTEEAQEAFQFAVDIWASLLPSDVEIVVDANFQDLGAGVLGAAGASFFARDFKNAPSDTTFYPIALAEKLAGEQLNLEGEPEIFCAFSSTFDFYFGTDANPPATQYDFVSIVLHELGHGLGFAGIEGFDTGSGTGTWDYFSNKSAVYNQYVEIGDGTALLDLQNNSAAVGDAITGGDLFFNGDLTVTTLGERAELYAPATYNGGSSFSHLDETLYPPGNAHTLMTPQAGSGEASHDPGVALDMFADMGWFITLLDHDIDRLVVDNFSDNITVEVELKSDTNIVNNTLKVVYSTDDFNTSSEVTLSEGDPNVYSASIPNPGSEAVLKYYFDGVEDGLGRSIRSPQPANSYYTVYVRDVASASVPFELSNNGDFENGDAGFFSVALEGDVNLWELGTPGNELTTSDSPTNVWKTDLDGDIPEGAADYSSALVSPYFDLSDASQNYVLKFVLGMELGKDGENVFEGGPTGANVEVSTDRGATWEVLGELEDQAGSNWYNFQNNGGGSFSTNVFDNEPGWILDSTMSVPVDYNISRLAGNEFVSFRVVFHSEADFLDAGYDTDGILIDDFEIESGDPTAEFIVSNASTRFFPAETINFEYISSGATSYDWDFGDGNSSTDENPSHSYSSGGTYDVTLTITYSGGTDVVTKENLITVFSEQDANYSLADGGNFETDNGDFVADNISGTGFERGNSSIAGKDGTSSGDFAWVTGLTDAEYADQSQAFLYTPLFDFSNLGNYELSFQANYDTELGWDGFIIEYSSDLGETWSQLEAEVAEGWYDLIGEDNAAQGWPAIPLFSGDTDGFVEKTRDISNLGGNDQVIFRFHWLSDFASTEIGIAIDDFELTGPVSGPGVPQFSFTNNTGCEGQEVVFTNESTGSITEMEWDFGANATPATATGVGPHTVTYSGAGTSTVTLTVTSPENGVTTEEKVDVIETSALHTPTVSRELVNAEYVLTSSAGDAYQWYRDGEILEGETGQTITVQLGDGGEFSVFVTVGSCEVEAEGVIVNGLNDGDVRIYPNPTSGIVKIEMDNFNRGNYQVLNTSGKVLLRSKFDNNQRIDISHLDDGVYFLILNVNNENIIRRLVKK